MNKLHLSLLMLFIAFSAMASTPVTITGTITHKSTDSIYLASTLNMKYLQARSVARVPVDANGKFSFVINIDQPIEAGIFLGKESFQIYLQPGDVLNISLDAENIDSTLQFTGTGSAENLFLSDYNRNHETPGILNDFQVRMVNMDQKGFLHFNDSVKNIKLNELKTAKKISPAFSEYMKMKIDYEWANNLVIYPRIISQVKGIDFKQVKPDSVYYSFLTPAFVQNEKAFVSALYLSFLSNYHANYTLNDMEKNGWPNNLFYEKEFEIAKKIYSGKVRDVMLANILSQKFQQDKSVASVKMYDDYATVNLDSNLLLPFKPLVESFHKLDPGKPFPASLVLTGPNGKAVHISDYKGKYVYIDFWASWCGPCKKEMPFSRILIDKFKDKEVVFLFISIDADQAKWQSAMTEEQLNGVHAISPGNWGSPVTKDLGVGSIPRYMFLDRDGNFINNDAPRPSGGAEQLIEQYLAQ